MTASCWFYHDSNARNDLKILKLRKEFGDVAYAHYFMLLEIMREEKELKLSFGDIEIYAMQCTCNADAYAHALHEEILCMCRLKLFESDSEFFWSERLREQAAAYEAIRVKKRNAANKRWNKTKDLTTQNKGNADAMHVDMHVQCERKERIERIEKKERKSSIEKLIETISIPENFPFQNLIEWLEYKQQRGELYKSKGLQALINKWAGNEEGFKRAVIDSMADNYAGLFDKGEKRNGAKRETTNELNKEIIEELRQADREREARRS